jgi:hypothetical protein
VTEWPATIDTRYHDAVIFEPDGMPANTSGQSTTLAKAWSPK